MQYSILIKITQDGCKFIFGMYFEYSKMLKISLVMSTQHSNSNLHCES